MHKNPVKVTNYSHTFSHLFELLSFSRPAKKRRSPKDYILEAPKNQDNLIFMLSSLFEIPGQARNDGRY